ncbi:transcription antitermination factor NusB [soil metagenome]
MGARNKARKRALDILFESELRGLALGATLPDHIQPDHSQPGGRPVNPYTVTLVEGVAAHQDRIDELLAAYSVGWTLDRMPVVDRNLLRLAVFEIMYATDVPDSVAVSEAVLLAGELSTDESAAFVNGLLAHVVELKPTLQT